MNRRKFFAGLALAPALPGAAVAAATNEPDVHGYFVTEADFARIENAFEALVDDIEQGRIQLIEAITAARSDPTLESEVVFAA